MAIRPKYEYCIECDDPTGNSGECDSLYVDSEAGDSEYGPLYQDCYDNFSIEEEDDGNKT